MDNFQRKFLDGVLGPLEVSPEFLRQMKPAGSLTPGQVMDVYRVDYKLRLREALGKNFEGAWLLLGDDEFTALSDEYVQSHPSALRNLTGYGDEFPEFLKIKNVDELTCAMASFENTYWKLFHQASRKLNPILPEQMMDREFDLSDLVLIESPIQIYRLWLKREGSDSELSLDDYDSEERIACYRLEDRVEVKFLSQEQFNLLKLIREQVNLNKVFTELDAMNILIPQDQWQLVLEILTAF